MLWRAPPSSKGPPTTQRQPRPRHGAKTLAGQTTVCRWSVRVAIARSFGRHPEAIHRSASTLDSLREGIGKLTEAPAGRPPAWKSCRWSSRRPAGTSLGRAARASLCLVVCVARTLSLAASPRGSADPASGRLPLGGRTVTGGDPTGALAEENLVVEAGEDSAQFPEPAGKDACGDCGQSLEHGIRLPTVPAGKHHCPMPGG